jgi:hypothetical protein
MTAVPLLARGRDLFHRKMRGESYRLLEAADRRTQDYPISTEPGFG